MPGIGDASEMPRPGAATLIFQIHLRPEVLESRFWCGSSELSDTPNKGLYSEIAS
jgi:hypothetical protein